MNPLLVSITLIASSALFIHSAHSQELPNFKQGDSYKIVRKKLIDSGWQKMNIDRGRWSDRCETSNTPKICYLYPEFGDSSIDGYCSFEWSNASNRRLRVSTDKCGGRFESNEESSPGTIMGWSFVSDHE